MNVRAIKINNQQLEHVEFEKYFDWSQQYGLQNYCI